MDTGRRLSFYDLITDEDLIIEIPMIQRDYAQGRDSEVEKRDIFVETLRKTLCEEVPKTLDLDFVYGSIVGGKFIPLDGQQRLTTLFLLYFFIAIKEDRQTDFRNVMLLNGNNPRFSYQTRTSSNMFCTGLIKECQITPLQLVNNKISHLLKDQHWFFYSWKDDPTVKAMLVMLDGLQTAFKNCDKIFDKLISRDSKPITFQFLNLKEFDLSDDLYIKMNARGKPLTRFENFKAWLQNFILENDYQVREVKWKQKLDGDWLDIFWDEHNPKAKVDKNFLNFFRLIAGYSYANLLPVKGELPDSASKNLDILLSDRPVTFSLLENNGEPLFNEGTLDFTFSVLNNLESLFSEEFKEITSNIICTPFQDDSIVNFVIGANDRKLDMAPRTFLFAVLLAVNHFDKPLNKLSSTEQGVVRDWLRITRNLIYNQNIQGNEDFIAAIKNIHSLSSNDLIIDANLLSELLEKGQFFRRDQVQEEILKIRLKEEDDHWVEFFNAYENHYYFYGRVCFLLKLPQEEKVDFAKVQFYSSRLANYFNIFKNTSDSLFQRALYTKGFALRKTKKNFSFYSWDASNVRQRNENWRDLFAKEEKLNLIKQLLDDERPLQQIIDEHDKDGWLSLIIKNPEVIRFCSNNNIRKLDNEGEDIRLLKATQTNGSQGELRSYVFFIKYLANLTDFYPFTEKGYYNTATRKEFPCAFLKGLKLFDNDIGLDIRYRNSAYEIRILDYNNTPLSEDILDILNKKNFEPTTHYDDDSKVTYLPTANKALDIIRILCSEFQNVLELNPQL